MKLPLLSVKQLLNILVKLGFKVIRQHGSHIFLKHPDGRTTTVPNHPGKDIKRSLLRKILRDIELSRKEFEKFIC